jgi:hypothetical protein
MNSIENRWLVRLLVVILVLNVRQYDLSPIEFQLQYKLLRELTNDVVEKQNSILQPCGDVVLMAN